MINPIKLVKTFKKHLDSVVDPNRLADPEYVNSLEQAPEKMNGPQTHQINAPQEVKTPNMQTAVNPPPTDMGIYPPVNPPNPKAEKKPDNRKKHSSGNNSFSLYMPQVRHRRGQITKLGEFEFAGEWTNIPYVIVMNQEGNAFVERLGIPLSRLHDPQEYQQYGLPFEAAEAMRWAFLANDKMAWSWIETRLVERKIEKSFVVYEVENIDVYKCAMWEGRHQHITDNGVAERVVDLYRDSKENGNG